LEAVLEDDSYLIKVAGSSAGEVLKSHEIYDGRDASGRER